MDSNKILTQLFIFIISLSFFNCASFKIPAPDGFASYKGTKVFRAVSPDGINFRVRTEKNNPFAEIPFWKEAMQNRMINAGYILVDSRTIKANDEKGEILEFAAPFGAEDYSYLIAIFAKNDELIIIESSGEVGNFQKKKSTIIAAINKIKF